MKMKSPNIHGNHKSSYVVTPASTQARDIKFPGSRDVRKVETSHAALNKAWPKVKGHHHHD